MGNAFVSCFLTVGEPGVLSVISEGDPAAIPTALGFEVDTLD